MITLVFFIFCDQKSRKKKSIRISTDMHDEIRMIEREAEAEEGGY